MNKFGKLVIAAATVFVGLQLIRPGIPAKSATAELQTTPEVARILETHCYSCHSDQRRLSWFDQIVPGYWLVRHDILTARSHLNFSTLGSKPGAVQRATLFEAVNMIQLGAMPLPSFVKLHPDARMSPGEIATLKAYLAPWAPVPHPIANHRAGSVAQTDAAPAAVAEEALPPISLASVRPELNGFQFDPNFEDWKPVSTTDRGDNNTFRFVLGNDVAVKAVHAGHISPWPDGARLAKIAWQQELGADGLLHPGKFVQVELMLKDASLYRDSEGWGWGRWRGMDLKPYGNDAAFVGECTSCHRPLRGNDYVYTLPISAARAGGVEVVNNRAAMLPANLPYQPLTWRAITMYGDPEGHTMATLYGNDAALQVINRRGGLTSAAKAPGYPPGSVLALVIWHQREDPHWFGARIPDLPQSVEFVQVEAGGEHNRYRRFAGLPLHEDRDEGETAAARTLFMLGLPPAELP
jgi:mono/diheme cytochrome c family protein